MPSIHQSTSSCAADSVAREAFPTSVEGTSSAQGLAIVVPPATDLNRGDQALVWQAASAALESGICDDVVLLDAGLSSPSDKSQTLQTQTRGYRVITSLLPNPRRNRNRVEDTIRESRLTFILMAINSVKDFLVSVLILLLARKPKLTGLFLDTPRYKTLDLVRQSKALFVKGGGFVHAHGGLRAPYYIWYQLYYMRLFQRLGKPVYFLPNSFGPFQGWTVSHQVKSVLSKCEFIAARETISAKALEALIGREVPVYPDMGYFLEPASREVGQKLCERFNIPIGRKTCVGITVRPWRFPGLRDSTGRFQQYMDSMAALVRNIVERGFHPVLVAHVLGPNAHENDELAITELVKHLGDLPFSLVRYDGDCSEIKALYGCLDYFVGTRFHSVIFAQACGVPSLAIAYGGNKSTGIMQDMGLGDYVIPIERVTAENLLEVFDRLVKNENHVRAAIARWQEEAWNRREAMLEEIRRAADHPLAPHCAPTNCCKQEKPLPLAV